MRRLIPNFFALSQNLLDLRVARTLLIGMTIFGTLGFVVIEGYDILDALYMTIITMSTVGFGEVRPLSDAGRVFVSILIVLNTGIFAYVLAAFSYYVIDGNIFQSIHRKRMQATISKTQDHVIVCGAGKYGHEVIEHLLNHQKKIVVIEHKEEKLNGLLKEFPDLLYVKGDATQDETLEEAGIERAANLITAVADDSDNLFIVLSAKQLNSKIMVVSRATDLRARAKIIKAGADHVIMPEQIGGFYMATLISKPGAVEFFSFITSELTSDVSFEEIRHDQLKPEFRGQPIRDLDLRHATGINIIAYRNPDGSYRVNPSPDTVIGPGGSFIALGTDGQIRALHKYLDASG